MSFLGRVLPSRKCSKRYYSGFMVYLYFSKNFSKLWFLRFHFSIVNQWIYWYLVKISSACFVYKLLFQVLWLARGEDLTRHYLVMEDQVFKLMERGFSLSYSPTLPVKSATCASSTRHLIFSDLYQKSGKNIRLKRNLVSYCCEMLGNILNTTS